MNTLRGRFAPTPSGRMHLGNVFCALISWLHIKSQGGEMVLRIEDLDRSRCKEEYVVQLLDDLRYLGLHYDEGPSVNDTAYSYFQSRRTEWYQKALNVLDDTNAVYPCYCSRDELHAPNAPHASDGRVIYHGTCRRLTEAQRAAKTRLPSYRIVASDKDFTFEDVLYGPQRINVREEWGDFIVRRSDGVFAYQLAVVVDDIAMGITDIVRGRDLLSSTGPQLQLYELLNAPPPQYLHIPMLLSPDGRRLSKRDRDLDMGALRAGIKNEAYIIGYLLYVCGVLDRNEPLSANEALSVFDIDKVIKKDIIVTSASLNGYTG